MQFAVHRQVFFLTKIKIMTFYDVYDVCHLMTFVAYDVCRIMTFVGYDVCRIMTLVGYDVCRIVMISLKGFLTVPFFQIKSRHIAASSFNYRKLFYTNIVRFFNRFLKFQEYFIRRYICIFVVCF